MKILLYIICTVVSVPLSAQVPRFSKQTVMETGAALYAPAIPAWSHSFSPDSSDVYTMEIASDTALLGAIIIRLREDLGSDSLLLNKLLWSYMDYLNQSSFKFKSVVPPGYGHKMEGYPRAFGILEYAANDTGAEYAVKGWIDGKYLAILYIGHNRPFNEQIAQLYLNGFRFPPQK